MSSKAEALRFIEEAMPKTRKEILEERRQLRKKYGELFDLTAALFVPP
jgi:hypothetical protein